MEIKKLKREIILLGAGGHGRVLIAILLQNNEKLIGYTDVIDNGTIQGVPYLGKDEVIFNYNQDSILLVNGLGSIGDNTIRKKLFTKFKKAGYSFKTVIHKKSIITNPCVIDEGAQIFAGAIVQPNAHIGSNTIINSGVIVEHDCEVGEHVHIAPGSVLSGGVIVGDETHIGTNSTVIQDVIIGYRSLIGAGSIVIKNIKDNVICWGNPAEERRNND